MTDPTRITKLPSSATIKQTTHENASTTVPEEKKLQTGIASAKDAIEMKKENALFTANSQTGEVKFGDGLSGKTPPVGSQNIAKAYSRMPELLQETKSEISSYLKDGVGTASPESSDIFRAMTEYLKMASKEAREDRKLQRDSRDMSMLGKEAKLHQMNENIDQQMQEAGEKADAAMSQATTQMTMGIAAGAISIGSAVDNLKGIASKARNELPPDTAIEARFQRFNSSLNDLAIAVDPSSSKKLQQEANKADIQTKKLENAASKDEDYQKSSTDHRDRMRDAINDFLTKMRDMDPKI